MCDNSKLFFRVESDFDTLVFTKPTSGSFICSLPLPAPDSTENNVKDNYECLCDTIWHLLSQLLTIVKKLMHGQVQDESFAADSPAGEQCEARRLNMLLALGLGKTANMDIRAVKRRFLMNDATKKKYGKSE